MLMKRYLIAAMLALIIVPAALSDEKNQIGFSDREFYKLDWNTENLRIGDVNGDGLKDIIVANNARARIECLLQRKNPDSAPRQEMDVNELPDDLRFESRPLLTEHHMFSMEVGDLNSDGRNDIAFYGDPRELVVVFQDEKGQWGPRRRFDILDGAARQAAIAIGDINGDARNDIVLLGAEGTYFIYQDEGGTLNAPVMEAGLPADVVAVLMRDFDGNKRQDLLYVCMNDAAPFVFRFQSEQGNLGPEVRCKTPQVRSLGIIDLDNNGSQELAAVQLQLSRMVLYGVASETSETSMLDGPFDRYALRSSAGRRAHSLALGAFTAKGRQEILVASPDAAEIELFAPAGDGTWSRQNDFPSLQGISEIAPIDEQQDGIYELVQMSPDEPMIGIAQFDAAGKLGFPRALPLVGKPSAMVVGNAIGDTAQEIIYASTQDKERAIRILARGDDAQYAEKAKVILQDARSDPDGLMLADANQDGIMDILVFLPYQEMRILAGSATGDFTDLSRAAEYGKGLVQGLKQKTVGLVDVTGDGKPEILVASKNFVRALVLDEKGRLVVKAQMNGRSANSTIAAVAGGDFNGDGRDEILMVDSANRCLTLLEPREDGGYEIVENQGIGQVNVEKLIIVNPLDAAVAKPSIVIMGQVDFSVLRPGQPKLTLKELADYETPVRNGRLENIAAADLNNDGKPEFILTESTKNLMEVVTWSEETPNLRRLLGWPVYEVKSFREGNGEDGSEPREFEIGDLTGDGLPDIVLLIHDRIIVYVQEK